MKYLFRLVPLIVLVVMMVACGSTKPVDTSEEKYTQSDPAYPPPVSTTLDLSYPSPQVIEQAINSGYPPPQEPTMQVKEFIGDIVPFVIITPLKAGSTEVKGTGPKGVSILFNDITFQGEVLGSTQVQDDGSFTLTVPPLQEQHRYGIKLAEIDNPNWNVNTFNNERFFGPNFMLVPQDGFYYDTAMVEP